MRALLLLLLMAVGAMAQTWHRSGGPPIETDKNRRSKWTKEKVLYVCNRTYEVSWVCNPDKILSPKQADNLDYYLKDEPLWDESGCQIQFRTILVRDLDENLVWWKGYQEALDQLVREVADSWIKNDSPDFCCHTILVILSLDQGYMRYGIAACHMMKPPFCRIKQLFAQNQPVLYKPHYFQLGLQQVWRDIKDNFLDTKTNCDDPYRSFISSSTSASASHFLLFSVGCLRLIFHH